MGCVAKSRIFLPNLCFIDPHANWRSPLWSLSNWVSCRVPSPGTWRTGRTWISAFSGSAWLGYVSPDPNGLDCLLFLSCCSLCKQLWGRGWGCGWAEFIFRSSMGLQQEKRGHGGINSSAYDSPLSFHQVNPYVKSHLFFFCLDILNGSLMLSPSPSTMCWCPQCF